MAALIVFGPEQQAAIAKAVAYARANVVTFDQLKAVVAGDRPPAGDYLEHIVVLPVGFRCVFSFEEQPQLGLCRHLSVSIHDKSDPDHARVPAPHVMNLIGREFGFKPGRLDGFWIEKEAGAANVIQRVCRDCWGLGIGHDYQAPPPPGWKPGDPNPHAPQAICSGCDGNGIKKELA